MCVHIYFFVGVVPKGKHQVLEAILYPPWWQHFVKAATTFLSICGFIFLSLPSIAAKFLSTQPCSFIKSSLKFMPKRYFITWKYWIKLPSKGVGEKDINTRQSGAPLHSQILCGALEDTGSLCCRRGTVNHLPLCISVNVEWEKGNAVSKQLNARREAFKYLWTEIKVCIPGEESMR